MSKVCILSFGNSTKYRLPVEESEDKDIALIRGDVKEFLKRKFPQLDANGFYDKVTLEELSEEEAKGYSLFDESALEAIKSLLGSEVRNSEAVAKLNLNAPFSKDT